MRDAYKEFFDHFEIKFDDSMSCLLARGHIDEKSLEITIPEQTLTTLTVPSYIDNMSFESLIINKDRIIKAAGIAIRFVNIKCKGNVLK